MKLSAHFDTTDLDPSSADVAANGNAHEGKRAHCEAAAWHAAAHELHLLAVHSHAEGDHALARYYAQLASGESDRAQEMSRQALAVSMSGAAAEDIG